MKSLKTFYRITLTVILLFATSNLFGAFANAAQRRRADEQKFLQTSIDDDITLTLGKPIERSLAGNEAHSYKILLAANQYLHVVVEQRGIDVVVTLFAPDGKKIAEVDSPNGTQGKEPLSIVAETAGNYRLEIRSPEPKAAPGSYEAKIAELRVATAQDKKSTLAAKLNADALLKINEGTAVAMQAALTIYQESMQLWRELKNASMEAETLDNIGTIYSNLGEKQKALDYYNQALVIEQALGARDKEAAVLSNIGVVLSDLGENQKALDFYRRTLAIQRETGNTSGENITLNNIGIIYDDLGEKLKALEYYLQSLASTREASDRRSEAITLNNIGVVYKDLGESQKALDYYNQALRLRLEIGDQRGQAQTLNNIGRIYNDLGEPEKALEYYNQSLSLRRKVGDRRGEAITLSNIGVIYNNLGENQKALDYFKLALPLGQAVGNRQGEAFTLNSLCVIYNKLGKQQITLDYCNQALTLFQAVGNRLGEANVLNNIGKVYDDLGEKQKAFNYYSQALTLARAVGDKSEEAIILYNIARYERNRGDLITALAQSESALGIIESLRIKVASPELRASYFASSQDYYQFYIDLLMRLHKQHPEKGFDAKALQASERARARSLLETLAEASADIRQGVDPVLLERERSVQQLLAGKSERLTRISNDERLKAQKPAAEKEVNELLAQYQDIQAQIRVKSPRYAALTQPVPSDLTQIQGLLDKDTVLLEYALGEERSYLWLVTQQSLKSYELPKRVLIEESANRLLETITIQNNAPVSNNAEYLKQQALVKQTRADFPRAAAELSKTLLGQIAAEIEGRRLLIVGDGVLQYVPFAALPKPVPVNGKMSAGEALTASSEIVSLPSASTLAALRREEGARPPRKPYTKTVAVFADPVFDADDVRVSSVVKSSKAQSPTTTTLPEAQKPDSRVPPAEPENPVPRPAKEVGMNNRAVLRRLLASKDEAEAIRAVAPTGQTTLLMNFDASRERVMTSNLAEYRIVHFATHGLLNEENPELSGVVFSLVDKQGKPQNGFLRLHEIFNLSLPVEMVVLSACQTGLGKKIKGEGLVGLTRGFMYAGAPRVVASLWAVDDTATKELMRIFYQKMLREKLSPAAALRAAQNEMREHKIERFRLPIHWSGFILQGEWRDTAPDRN
ncbi:MAG TPA: CHAT domain-containing tetratricopeptide repeat protein [Pyrinomonadaceae bacterium]|jgi:CHAT domain-containing protein/Tfp pilus assembly protein PilF